MAEKTALFNDLAAFFSCIAINIRMLFIFKNIVFTKKRIKKE
ncbi:MAG: hypothetical protein PHT91_00220 [Candidatus Nanoarchaeia archaeon]|nr:hypothetical protein [Candidatus Nanoarchaeia archaeon]